MVYRRNCNDICHTVANISTSGSDGHTAISGRLSMTHLLVDTFFEFDAVANFFRGSITVILISDLFGCAIRVRDLE